eukprot:scaffold68508_cov55-Phaeocystis_antarctica.AAC.2
MWGSAAHHVHVGRRSACGAAHIAAAATAGVRSPRDGLQPWLIPHVAVGGPGGARVRSMPRRAAQEPRRRRKLFSGRRSSLSGFFFRAVLASPIRRGRRLACVFRAHAHPPCSSAS